MEVVHVLNRVFDGKDMTRLVLITIVDHGSQCRRLSRTGGSHNQNQAPGGHDQTIQQLGQVQ